MVALNTTQPEPPPRPGVLCTDAPPLPPGIDRQTANLVIDHFLSDQALSITDIANECKVSLPVLGLILESDYVQNLIHTIKRLAAQRAEVIAADLKTAAIFHTRDTMLSSPSPGLAQQAAFALLKLGTLADRVPSLAAQVGGRRSDDGPSPRKQPTRAQSRKALDEFSRSLSARPRIFLRTPAGEVTTTPRLAGGPGGATSSPPASVPDAASPNPLTRIPKNQGGPDHTPRPPSTAPS